MKRINLSITKKGSIERAIRDLVNYKQGLHSKTEKFIESLMEVGIKTAEANSGEYAGMILFKKELNPTIDGCDGILIAVDKQKIIKEWYASKKNALEQKNVRSYEVSPLLLAEFGSGWLSKVLDDVSGVGQGTMPDSQHHAFDPDGWYWYDDKGEKHHSVGESPTFPMHSASTAMLFEIDRIAREVFHG